MSKRVDKIVIPISFEDEKQSLSKLKSNMVDLQKTMTSSYGKNLIANIMPQLNESIKLANKEMAKINKPLTSKKDAENLGNNIAAALNKVSSIVTTLQNNFKELFNPKEAAVMAETIQEITSRLNKLKMIRERWTDANRTIASTGNKDSVSRELRSNQKRQGELTEKSATKKLSKQELAELEELKQKEIEYIEVLKQKKQAEEEIAILRSQNNIKTLKELDDEIKEQEELIELTQNSGLSQQDYDIATDGLKRYNAELQESNIEAADLGKNLGDAFEEQRLGQAASIERQQTFNTILRETLGITISLESGIRIIKKLANAAFDFYKSLDTALTDITIVSNMTRSQVQLLTNDFIALSAKTGMAIDDIAQASVIFFQQGLSTAEVLKMTEVTAQFAKVAGSTVEKAADQLTAAVNGYKVGVEGAIDVADKLNAVAAKSAASIDELATAMSKAASQANQAGLSMDKFYAIIATIEEVTREAPENIGTSLKTIMARMQQIKEGNNTEDDTDVNAVETALKTVGIALRDANGQLRDLEEILDELGPMWNTLDRNTQAYLGTIIAGTRQQSRFISMMQNWDRVLELTQVSQNSAGQQALMHEKAMQGLDAAINTLTNSWQKFLTTLTNSDTFISILKTATDIMQNLSKRGATAHLAVAGLSIIMRKFAVNISLMGTNLKRSLTSLKSFVKDTKQGYKPLQSFNKGIKDSYDKVKVTKAAYDSATASVQKYVTALRLKQEGEDSEFGKNIKGTIINLEEEIATLQKKTNLTEEDKIKLQQLNAELERYKQIVQASTLSTDQLNNKLGQSIKKEKESKEAYEESLTKYQESVSTITMIISVVETLISVLGLSDNAFANLAVGAIAAIATIYMAIKAFHTSAMKFPIYAILAVGLTAVTAIIQGFKLLLDDGTEALAEAKENLEDTTESFQNLGTKIKGINEYLEVFDRLNSKIIRTKEEQEELNEAIQGLSELTNIAYRDNGDGSYYIDDQAVRSKLENSIMKDYASSRKEMEEAAADVLKKQKNVEFKQKHIAGKQISNAAGWMLSTMIFGVPGFIIGAVGWAKIEDKIVEEIRKARGEAFDKVADELASGFKDIVDIASETDMFGNIVVSAASKAALNDEMKRILTKDYRDKYANQDLSEDKLMELINKDIDNYAEYFSAGRGKIIFDEIAKDLEQNSKEMNSKTYNQMSQDIDNKFKLLMSNIEEGSEEYKALLKLKQTEMNALWQQGDFNLKSKIEEYQKTDPELGNALANTRVGALMDLNDIGVFSGTDFAKGFLKGLNTTFDEEDPSKTVLARFNELYAQSTSEGYKYLSEAIYKYSQSNEQYIDEAIGMLDLLNKKLNVSNESWASWGEKIKKVTTPLKSLNSVFNELSENGEITLDTFMDFMDVLDEMSTSLDGKQLTKFMGLLDQLDIDLNENTGNILMNGKSVDGMRKIYSMMVQNKLKDMAKEKQATIENLQNEVELRKQEIKLLEDKAKAGETEVEIEQQTTEGVGTAENEQIDVMTKAANAELEINRQKLAGFQAQQRASMGDKAIPMVKINNSQVNSAASQGNTQAIGVKPAEKTTINIDDRISQLNGEIDNLNKQIKVAKRMKAWLDKLSRKDWSKLGTGSKSNTSKALDEYEGKLNQILALLTHIEQEETKISVLDKLRGMQTGRARIKNLLKEIELVEHLQGDYVDKYNLEKDAALAARKAIQGAFGKIITFNDDGSYDINEKKYKKLNDDQKKKLDELIDEYKQAIQDANESFGKIMENIQTEIESRQAAVDEYISAENKLVEAIKVREKKILEAKLAAIDKEIEAIEKVAEARRKAREEESDAAEMSGLQVDLQRALMDSSGASASQILSLQKQIKDKQKEMADSSFDNMVNDMKQQLEDEKQLEQDLFDERLEEMDWYWAEVDRIMSEGVQSILDTMQLYGEEYNQASQVQQAEILKGWNDTFEAATAIGKVGALGMQDAIKQIQEAMNKLEPEDIEAWLNLAKVLASTDLGIQPNEIDASLPLPAYASGGMNYKTGVAWLDGTRSNPEAVLNAAQTKAFLSFTDDLAALRASGGITNNANVIIDTISFNVDSMSSPEDGEKAFDAFVNKFKQIGAKQGISVNGTANRF